MSPRRPTRKTIQLGRNSDCLEIKNLKKKFKKTIKKGHSDNFFKMIDRKRLLKLEDKITQKREKKDNEMEIWREKNIRKQIQEV